MEPWLDSLSEDWKSEHRSSSPAPSLSSDRQHGSGALSGSQSRIPHLANNMRKDSSTGSFLRPRSTRGRARANGESVLRERSASSLNVRGLSGSQKYTSLPRRPSSVFSETQNSVQHHTIHEKPVLAETPEWKRRLGNGEDVASDGFDLFSPSKLEGIFKQPTPSQLHSEHDADENNEDPKPLKPFFLPTSHAFPEQYSSVRATRSRLNLEVLEEVNEEEDTGQHNLSAVSSDLARTGSLRGLVRQRVQSLERGVGGAGSGQSSPREIGDNVQDGRWRTISGQEELKNELISPVTVSKQNSIRATILRNSYDVDIQALQSNLQKAASANGERPTSSSSDRDVSYAYNHDARKDLVNEPLPDITSHSLPDDLSMGTQDFISHGGFINSRRGGRSNEASFLRRSLSITQEEPSEPISNSRDTLLLHSSPPRHSRLYDDSIEQSRVSASAPATPQDTSIIHHAKSQVRPASSGSPLKLFGNRDTYTNNKLMRILSQFEEPDSSRDGLDAELPEEQQENEFRMSQFGQGDLDGFGFVNDIPRPPPIEAASIASEDRIFKPVATTGADADAPNTDVLATNREIEHVQEASEPIIGVRSAENDRTTKRRKTLLKDQITVDNHELEVKVSNLEETATLAGKKRKDARPGDDGIPADPEVLATRSLLRPKSARSRRLSADRLLSESEIEAGGAQGMGIGQPEEDLTEALAAELATFAQEAAEVNNDSRKPSLATKDYMEEANKVMQFIRSRGKPKPALPHISEPGNVSELNPDAILDLEIDAESTKDSFSRPPSRERSSKPAADRRHARHDSRTASYLRRYQDDDTSSVFNDLAPADDNPDIEEAPGPNGEGVQESSPPNMRILNQCESMRKRKHSTSTVEGPQDATQGHHLHTHQSSHSSTLHTFPTNSSTSGQKGVIALGTVSIPDHVGAMTFDHEKKIWIKKMCANEDMKAINRRERRTLTDDDPFEDIPDLSIDEQRELGSRARQTQVASNEEELTPTTGGKEVTNGSRKPLNELDRADVKQRGQILSAVEEGDDEGINRGSRRSQASKHEAKLHDGVASRPPPELHEIGKQARVVTIAFSSPVVSAVNYAQLSEDDFDDLPREEDLPLDDSEIDLSDGSVIRQSHPTFPAERVTDSLRRKSRLPALEQEAALTFQPRTISPIEEGDEDQPFDGQKSLVHVKHSNVLTPAPPKSIATLQKHCNKASSILCLTPLSDFSVHQLDKSRDPDQSYVEERKHPNALRQAHGSMALAVDGLVKAITDAVHDELFWEQLQRMTLAPNSVSSIHGLEQYCPLLEELNVAENKISQLGGLPSTLRVLDIHNNMLNDLASWGHLQNLQYLDVCGNQLESLEGFSSLVHLRSLKANNNCISSINGILDLDGLLELDLSSNDLRRVDFQGSELNRLRSLDLSHNQLEIIDNVHCLRKLEKLNLSYNELRNFPSGDIEQNPPLKELYLAHNKLEWIGLKDLPTIQHLDLDNNRIKNIDGLSVAYHLDFLSLRAQSKSSDIVDLILSTPNECRHIRLSSNSVRDGTLKLPPLPQNNLRELEVAACGISELPERFGSYFPNVRYLNTNFNAIKDIAPLRKMMHLRTLLLAKNRIKKLRRTCLVFSKLGSLEHLDLRDNPLTVGFYSPISTKSVTAQSLPEARYHLPGASREEDASWVKVLDEVTGLKRRTIELLLAEHCVRLAQLDGLDMRRETLTVKDEVWEKLTLQRVLVKPEPRTEEGVVERIAGEDEGMIDAQGHRETQPTNDGETFDG